MPKNIVVFSDGTAQEGGEGENSNVYRMFNMIEDRTDRQIVFYDRGVGTGWHKLTGSIGGFGISRNIKQAYTFISENFKSGDSIYLIGFSRGAATLRSLSALIHHFGILPKSRPELIKQAYRIYKTKDKAKLKVKAQQFIKRHHTMWADIKFIGCYDTVPALGLSWYMPSKVLDRIPGFSHRFHDFKLSESVKNAYHALAIDDERKTFHPVLWDPKLKEGQSLRQVWFAGMHTDVGGGYKERGLSDIALVWLTDQAVQHGLWIYPKHDVEVRENASDLMHDSRGKWFLKLYRRQVRYWDTNRPDKPLVHASVLERVNTSRRPPGDKPYQRWILKLDYDTEPWHRIETRPWHVPRISNTNG